MTVAKKQLRQLAQNVEIRVMGKEVHHCYRFVLSKLVSHFCPYDCYSL